LLFKVIGCHFRLHRRVGDFLTRQAQTLNSGIFEIGSSARIVIWLAAFFPGQ
jgi:hypothetical protein